MRPTTMIDRCEATVRATTRSSLRELLGELGGLELTDMQLGRVARAVERHADSSDQTVNAVLGRARVPGSAERSIVLDAATNNETSFFRGRRQLAVLARFLPATFTAEQPFRVWSAACSTGEEAVTLAILATEKAERLGADGPKSIQVIGTDLNDRAIEIARRGTYGHIVASQIGPRRLQRFFDTGRHGFEVGSRLPPVHYVAHNLVVPFGIGTFDLVVLRNVLFYLDRRSREHVVLNACAALRPGGIIVFGANDGVKPPGDYETRLQSLGAFCFRLDSRR